MSIMSSITDNIPVSSPIDTGRRRPWKGKMYLRLYLEKLYMNGLNDMSSSLEATIKDTDLQNVTLDLAESFADSILKDGLLKDIPIFGTIVGLTKSSLNLRDRLFLKKLIHFLTGLNTIEQAVRHKMISDIDSSSKFKIRVGEKLLYILDKCDDHIAATRIAKLFSSFLKRTISYAEFLMASAIVDRIFVEDLESFITISKDEIEKVQRFNDDPLSEFQHRLINVGICASSIDKINVSDQDDWKAREKYVVEGGEANIYITEIGYIIKKELQ